MKQAHILDMINYAAQTSQEAPALINEEGSCVSYAQLISLIEEGRLFFKKQNIVSSHRIAAALSDGLEMSMAFLTISNVAAFAPLNAALSKAKFVDSLKLLKADYILLKESDYGPAREAAEELNLPIIEQYFFWDEGKPQQRFAFQGSISSPVSYALLKFEEFEDFKSVKPETISPDIAMFITTSGTTAIPKVIHLTHRMLISAAVQRIGYFELSKDDRVLIITPFHHSISYNIGLSSVLSGSCMICAGRYEPTMFFRMIESHYPTWFGAGPAVLKSMVTYASDNNLGTIKSNLRFIRSSGAMLSEKLHQSLLDLFQVPVVVTYGMTETRTIASSYKAPLGHKAGSVGIIVDSEVRIVDEKDKTLPRGSLGQLLVRGPNVIDGYDDPTLNKASFVDGWFKTGDMGYMDQDDYLFLVGRIKEIINRGGEKISPYEVEKEILGHPDILDAVVFGITVADGIEEPAAAIILSKGSSMDILALRRFLRGRLTAYKMPVSLYIVSEIPVGKEGKVVRSSLHGLLEQSGNTLYKSGFEDGKIHEEGKNYIPIDDVEKKLIKIYKKTLRLRRIGANTDFFELGGDSLRAALLFAEIEKTFGIQLSLAQIYRNSQIPELAELIRTSPSKAGAAFIYPVTQRTKAQKDDIIFAVHAAEGDESHYVNLGRLWENHYPIVGLRYLKEGSGWHHPITIKEIAAAYVKAIRQVQPDGPYHLLGFCLGGVVAYEMANILREAGEETALLALIDPIINKKIKTETAIVRNVSEFKGQSFKTLLPFLVFKAKRKWTHLVIEGQIRCYAKVPAGVKPLIFKTMLKEAVLRSANRTHRPSPYPGAMVYFQPEGNVVNSDASIRLWREVAGEVRVIPISGIHENVLKEPHIRDFSDKLLEAMQK